MRKQETNYTIEQISNANHLIDLLDTIPENRRNMVVLMALSFVRGMETEDGINKQAIDM